MQSNKEEAGKNGAGTESDLSKMNFDNEVLAFLSNRKDQLIETHEEYIMNH